MTICRAALWLGVSGSESGERKGSIWRLTQTAIPDTELLARYVNGLVADRYPLSTKKFLVKKYDGSWTCIIEVSTGTHVSNRPKHSNHLL